MTFAKKCVLIGGNKNIRDEIASYLPEHQLIPQLNNPKCRCEYCRDYIARDIQDWVKSMDKIRNAGGSLGS